MKSLDRSASKNQGTSQMGKKRDYGLILSLGIIIAAGSYWFVKELPNTGMEHYLDLLGDKLVALVPNQSEKEKLSSKYNELKELVKDKEVRPEDVEKMAAAIINFSNAQDTLSLSEAESLLELIPVRADSVMENFKVIAKLKPLPEKWKELHAQLGAINELDKKLEEMPVISGTPPSKNYRVDSNLNIIIDSSERQKLQNDTFIRKLEKEKRLIWVQDMIANLKKDLKKLEDELAEQKQEYNQNIQNIEQMKLQMLAEPFIDKSIMLLDSLEIVNSIDWDSLQKQVVKELEKEYRKIEKAESPAASVK